MICDQVEKSVRRYLANVVAGSPDALQDTSEPFTTTSAGLPQYASGGGNDVLMFEGVPLMGGSVFMFYVGESGQKIKLPCAIIAAAAGSAELNSGNDTIDVDVEVKFPTIPYRSNTDDPVNDPALYPIDAGQAVAQTIRDALCAANLVEQLNAYREAPAHLTVIGVTARNEISTKGEESITQQVTLSLYVAGSDVL